MSDDQTPVEAPAPVEEPTPPGETLRFSTTLRPSSFLMLSLKNGLLNIITLTLYRFWGKTEVRRRIWQGVRLNDEPFEYTGRGKELFFGFLLALVALGLPFLILVFGAQFLGPMVALPLILVSYIGVFWLWGFGLFTAWRYLASRTTWRGVRFRLGGSATGYGFFYLGGLLLTSITLGWYTPTFERNLAEKTWDETRFGDKRIRFRMARAERKGVYGAFAIGWCLTVVLYFAAVFVFVGVMAATSYGMTAPLAAAPAPGPEVPPDWAFTLILYGVALLLSPLFFLIWAPYQAAILRSQAAGITIDSVGFALKVKAVPLWWLTITNLFALLFTLGLLMPWVQARTAKYLIERLEAAGTAELDQARQTTAGPKTGEGLADAFGFSII